MSYFDPDGEPMTLEEWAAIFERRHTDPDTSWWRKQTQVGGAEVLTMWLGCHPPEGSGRQPLIWETMIFENEDPVCRAHWRYTSREEALLDHYRIVACLREGRKP